MDGGSGLCMSENSIISLLQLIFKVDSYIGYKSTKSQIDNDIQNDSM